MLWSTAWKYSWYTHTHLWLAESHKTLGSTAEKEVSISSFNTSGIRASFQELPLYGYKRFRTGSLMVLNCSSWGIDCFWCRKHTCYEAFSSSVQYLNIHMTVPKWARLGFRTAPAAKTLRFMMSLRPCRNFCKSLKLVLIVLLSALKLKLYRLPSIFQRSKATDQDLPCTSTDLLLCSRGPCKEHGEPGLTEAPQILWWSGRAVLLHPGQTCHRTHLQVKFPTGWWLWAQESCVAVAQVRCTSFVTQLWLRIRNLVRLWFSPDFLFMLSSSFMIK